MTVERIGVFKHVQLGQERLCLSEEEQTRMERHCELWARLMRGGQRSAAHFSAQGKSEFKGLQEERILAQGWFISQQDFVLCISGDKAAQLAICGQRRECAGSAPGLVEGKQGNLISAVGRVFCVVGSFSGHGVGSPGLFARTPGLGKVQHCQQLEITFVWDVFHSVSRVQLCMEFYSGVEFLPQVAYHQSRQY